MLRRTPLLPLLLVTACAVGPQGYGHPDVRDVLVITESEAAQLEITPTPVTRYLASGGDGDVELQAFLQHARVYGASHVSSIAIHLVVADANGPVDCVTRIGPREEIETHAAEHPGYESKLELVTTTVNTYVRRCSIVRRSSGIRSGRSEQQCHSVPRTRIVTHYQYQQEARWVPPSLGVISARYSHGPLVESQPTCQPLAPDAPTANRIEAQIYVPPTPPPGARPRPTP